MRCLEGENKYCNPCSFGMFMFFILGIICIFIANFQYFNTENMKKLWSIAFFIIGIILLFISISSYPIWFFLEYKYSRKLS